MSANTSPPLVFLRVHNRKKTKLMQLIKLFYIGGLGGNGILNITRYQY